MEVTARAPTTGVEVSSALAWRCTRGRPRAGKAGAKLPHSKGSPRRGLDGGNAEGARDGGRRVQRFGVALHAGPAPRRAKREQSSRTPKGHRGAASMEVTLRLPATGVVVSSALAWRCTRGQPRAGQSGSKAPALQRVTAARLRWR